MKKLIHRYDWSIYSFDAVIAIFKEHFQNVTALPEITVFNALYLHRRATIELLENRTISSIYRIKELGECYQIYKHGQPCTIYQDYDHYLRHNPIDELLEIFTIKPITFSIDLQSDGSINITRHKEPKFKCTYLPNDQILTTSDENVNFVNEQWDDPSIQPDEKLKVKKKLAIYIKKYIHTPTNQNNYGN